MQGTLLQCCAMAVVAKAASFLPAVGFSRSREPSCSVRSGSALCLRAGVRRKNLKQFGGKVSCGALLKASSFSAASSSFQGRLFLVVTCPSGASQVRVIRIANPSCVHVSAGRFRLGLRNSWYVADFRKFSSPALNIPTAPRFYARNLVGGFSLCGLECRT